MVRIRSVYAAHKRSLEAFFSQSVQYFQKAFMGGAYMSLAVSGARVPGVVRKASSIVAIRLYSLYVGVGGEGPGHHPTIRHGAPVRDDDHRDVVAFIAYAQ